MENSRNRPEDEGNKDEETTPKRWRKGDFLSQYLLRRKELLGEDIEDDEKNETDEKPKKWSRLFSGVFKRVVAPPEGVNKPSEKRNDKDSSIFGYMATPEQTINETSAEGVASSEEDESSEQPDIEDREEIDAEDVNHEDPPEVIEELEVPNFEPTMTQQRRVEAQPIAERAIYERSVPEPQEREVVIERAVGTALPVVLVGAEYLARKSADKKIERKFNKKVGSLEKDINQGDLARLQLDTLVQQNREQLEALKRERGAMEKTPTPVHMEVARPKIDQQPKPKPEVDIHREQKLESKMEQSLKPEYTPEQKSRIIMERVADAAEHDVAVESAYELRHEIKDDTSVAGVASSVGAIMAARLAEKEKIARQLRAQQPNFDSGLPIINDQPQGDMYKKAMNAGFWAAMMIIILGTLAYLMVK